MIFRISQGPERHIEAGEGGEDGAVGGLGVVVGGAGGDGESERRHGAHVSQGLASIGASPCMGAYVAPVSNRSPIPHFWRSSEPAR